VHHSDRGTQYLCIRYTERLAEAGITPSVGSVGDSYDNALCESVIGLFKTEVIERIGPWRNVQAVEIATLEWVAWFNGQRLLEPLGYLPPSEYEAMFVSINEPQPRWLDSTNRASGIPGTIQSSAGSNEGGGEDRRGRGKT
jgi:transposase InsO family protein